MDNTETPERSAEERTPFTAYSDATDRQAASRYEGGADTSQLSDHDASTVMARDYYPEDIPRGLAPVLELPEEGYQGGPRLEVLSDTNGASLTPLTGVSSELQRMIADNPSSDSKGGIASGEEVDDTDPEDLETIWVTHGIAKTAIKTVLSERVHRHVREELQRNKKLNPTPLQRTQMVQNLAIVEAQRYAVKQEKRGSSTASITSTLSHYTYSPKVDTPDKERPMVASRPNSRASQRESVAPPTEVPQRRTATAITESTSQESGHFRPIRRPPPSNWRERVRLQRARNGALSAIGTSEGYLDHTTESVVKQESSHSTRRGDELITLRTRRTQVVGNTPITPMSQQHYPE